MSWMVQEYLCKCGATDKEIFNSNTRPTSTWRCTECGDSKGMIHNKPAYEREEYD